MGEIELSVTYKKNVFKCKLVNHYTVCLCEWLCCHNSISFLPLIVPTVPQAPGRLKTSFHGQYIYIPGNPQLSLRMKCKVHLPTRKRQI